MLRHLPLRSGARPGESGGQAVLGVGGSGHSERRLPGSWGRGARPAVVSQALVQLKAAPVRRVCVTAEAAGCRVRGGKRLLPEPGWEFADKTSKA